MELHERLARLNALASIHFSRHRIVSERSGWMCIPRHGEDGCPIPELSDSPDAALDEFHKRIRSAAQTAVKLCRCKMDDDDAPPESDSWLQKNINILRELEKTPRSRSRLDSVSSESTLPSP